MITPNPGSCIDNFSSIRANYDRSEYPWLTIDNEILNNGQGTRRIHGTVPTITEERVIDFEVTGTDGFNNAHTIPIRIKLVPDTSPTLPFVPPINLEAGFRTYTLPTAIGGNGQISYTLTDRGGLPTGVTLTTYNGAPRLIGVFTRTNWITFSYSATDEDEDTVSREVTLRVDSVSLPWFRNSSTTDISLSVGQSVDRYLAIALGGVSPITYTLSYRSGDDTMYDLPDGIVFDSRSVRLHGTATSSIGRREYTLSATDRYGRSATKTVILSVGFTLFYSEDSGPFTARVDEHFEHVFFDIQRNLDFLEVDTPTLPAGMRIARVANLSSRYQNYKWGLVGYPETISPETSYTLTFTDTAGNTESINFTLVVQSSTFTAPVSTANSTFKANEGIQVDPEQFCGDPDTELEYSFIRGFYSNHELPAVTAGRGPVSFGLKLVPAPNGYSNVWTYGLTQRSIARRGSDGQVEPIPILFGSPTTRQGRNELFCLRVFNNGVFSDQITIRVIN